MISRGRVVAAVLELVLLSWAVSAAAATPAWTTYHHDAARSGIDPDSTSPLPPTQIWRTPALDGRIWAEPLLYGSRVYAATENDTVYALDAATGAVVWQTHLATAVPASDLLCGDIRPIVGITSTPVIDPATGRIYVVADTLNGSSIAHQMFVLNLSDGSLALGPVPVDPPGSTPADLLQRASLALDAGKVIIGYGGNSGDCGTYHGWLVAVPESGGPLQTFEVDGGSGEKQGAIWGSGNAPAIDSSGDIWVATGNGSSATFDYQEAVIRLGPDLNVLDWWAPSDWKTLDIGDGDLGSSMPLLLPGGLVFEIGKQGIGYLLNATNLGHTAAPPVYSASVCSGSWGGGIYVSGVIYVGCANGMHALALNQMADTFAPVPGWTVNAKAIAPPIFAGGLIWSAGYNDGVLYGLDPSSGATRFSSNLGGFEHFMSPSAGGGLLLVANADDSSTNADDVTAFSIATPTPETPPGTPAGVQPGTPASGPAVTPAARPVISKLHVRVVHRRLRLSLWLSERATVRLVASKLVPGRMVGGRCLAGAKHGRRCRRRIPKMTHRFAGRSGHNAFAPSHVLAPGRYVVTVTAVDASGRRSQRRTVFVIVVLRRGG